MNASSSANSTISSKRLAISRFERPSMMPLMKTFSRPEISGWKPAPSSMSAEIRPRTVTVPVVGLVMPGHQLQGRALAGAVPADDAEGPALGDRERHAPQRRKLLVGLQVLDEAPLEQGALERRELFSLRVAAVHLRDVDELDRVHTSSANESRSRSKRK